MTLIYGNAIFLVRYLRMTKGILGRITAVQEKKIHLLSVGGEKTILGYWLETPATMLMKWI
jgi:hypothetical protein